MGGGGDELYGVEPLSYYVKNLALNWNAVAVLGLLSLPLVLLSGGAQGTFSVSSSSSKSPSSSGIGWVLLPLYLWLAVVVPRPHKEERFLFPIYPFVDVAHTPALHRILYVPWLRGGAVAYKSYAIYERT